MMMGDDKRAILVQSKLTTPLFNLTHPVHVFSYYIFCILIDLSKPSLGVVKGAYQIKYIIRHSEFLTCRFSS